MKLWLLTQTVETEPPYVAGMVVAAETEQAAKAIHPDQWDDPAKWSWLYWAHSPRDVRAQEIGTTTLEPGIVLVDYRHDNRRNAPRTARNGHLTHAGSASDLPAERNTNGL